MSLQVLFAVRFSAFPAIQVDRDDSIPTALDSTTHHGLFLSLNYEGEAMKKNPIYTLASAARLRLADGDVIDIIFAGYKTGIPTVDVIGVTCDWDARQLSAPKLVVFNPSHFRPDNTNILPLGRSDAIQRTTDPLSGEAKAVAKSYPGVLAGFDIMRHNGSLVRSATAVTIACDMIRLQGEFDPEDVGPPINIVVLSLSHKPDVRRLPR
jgi:hypothetical protein